MSYEPIIIGIAGEEQSGKSTLAWEIAQTATDRKYIWNFFSFMHPVYKAIAAMYGMQTGRVIELAEKGGHIDAIPVRTLTSTLHGRWGRRDMRADFWIDRLKDRLDLAAGDPPVVIIDDVTEENEAEWVSRQEKGILIGVRSRQEDPRWELWTHCHHVLIHDFNGVHTQEYYDTREFIKEYFRERFVRGGTIVCRQGRDEYYILAQISFPADAPKPHWYLISLDSGNRWSDKALGVGNFGGVPEDEFYQYLQENGFEIERELKG